MSSEIIDDWLHFYLQNEIKAHFGDTKVILTLDNAGPHPQDLGHNNDQIEVKLLPPNTTPLIQPMDMGVIYTFKRAYMNRYYNKMMDHVLHLPDNDDPIVAFSKTYNIRDCIYDIAKAWDSVDKPLIHKCFENLLSPDSYLFEYNVKYHRNDQWTGLDFRGFEAASDASDAKLIQMPTCRKYLFAGILEI